MKLHCGCACHKGICGWGYKQRVCFTTQVIKLCIHWTADWVGLRCHVDTWRCEKSLTNARNEAVISLLSSPQPNHYTDYTIPTPSTDSPEINSGFCEVIFYQCKGHRIVQIRKWITQYNKVITSHIPQMTMNRYKSIQPPYAVLQISRQHSSSVHTHTCLSNTGVNVTTVTTILYHKSYKLSILYPWKWTETFTVRSQWLSYDRAGAHNVLYTNPQKNMRGIQSRPLRGHGKGPLLPVYWPGNWACSTVYTDIQNSGMTNSVASNIHSTTKYYMLCHSPLTPVMFQFVGVTKYVFFKPKISFSDTLYFAY